jgi:hypothetical protein
LEMTLPTRCLAIKRGTLADGAGFGDERRA